VISRLKVQWHKDAKGSEVRKAAKNTKLCQIGNGYLAKATGKAPVHGWFFVLYTSAHLSAIQEGCQVAI
jgi:hypothetical protein